MEDLYKILGVEKNATADEIKKAYRNLAFKYHPDRNAGSKDSEDKFKQINEAYSVLGDESKRRQYDMFGSGTQSQQSANSGYGNQYSDPYEEFFRNAYGFNQNNYNSGNQQRYTYTYTTRETETPKGRKAFSYFCNSLIKILLSLIGLATFGRWSFIIMIICFISLFKGIMDAGKNLIRMFEK